MRGGSVSRIAGCTVAQRRGIGEGAAVDHRGHRRGLRSRNIFQFRPVLELDSNRWLTTEEQKMSFLRDLRVALRSLARTKGLAITVALTLALGIGANAAIFALVRGVLLRPLVNRDENRLIYIRQSAPSIGIENANFSVPEIQDLPGGVKPLSSFCV